MKEEKKAAKRAQAEARRLAKEAEDKKLQDVRGLHDIARKKSVQSVKQGSSNLIVRHSRGGGLLLPGRHQPSPDPRKAHQRSPPSVWILYIVGCMLLSFVGLLCTQVDGWIGR